MTLFYTVCIAVHVAVTGECRVFKFDVQVDNSKSHPTDNKPSLKGAWSHYMTHFCKWNSGLWMHSTSSSVAVCSAAQYYQCGSVTQFIGVNRFTCFVSSI